jgi:hypothetical protein
LALLSNDNELLDLPYDTEIVESDQAVSATIEGRTIFDVAFLVEQLKTFGHHSEGLFGCSGNKVEKLFSEPKDESYMDVNTATVSYQNIALFRCIS